MLHGMEAVVTPKQLSGLLGAQDLLYRGTMEGDPLKNAQTLELNNFKDGLKDFKDSIMLVKDKITGGGEDKLVVAINNLNKTLNTNNMIASMIERNTKSTNNNLANMSGTLV